MSCPKCQCDVNMLLNTPGDEIILRCMHCNHRYEVLRDAEPEPKKSSMITEQPIYCTVSQAEHYTNSPCPGCERGERERIKDWFAVVAYHLDRQFADGDMAEKERDAIMTAICNCTKHAMEGKGIQGNMVSYGREAMELHEKGAT